MFNIKLPKIVQIIFNLIKTFVGTNKICIDQWWNENITIKNLSEKQIKIFKVFK